MKKFLFHLLHMMIYAFIYVNFTVQRYYFNAQLTCHFIYL